MKFDNIKTSISGRLGSLQKKLAESFEDAQKRSNAPRVAVIKLHGTIMPGGKQGTLSADRLSSTISAAFNSKADAVALDINSPGGSPVQSALIGEQIRYWADKTNTPVFSFAQDVAASGGYWLACSGDEIYAMPSSIVGSIGVISASFGFDEAIKKLGVERRIITAGDNKSKNDAFKPVDPKDVNHIKEIQSEIHDDFKKWVKDRRQGKLKGTDKTLMNGDVWTASKAKTNGIIDGVGSLQSVMRSKYGDNVRFVTFSPKAKFNLLGGLPFQGKEALESKSFGREIVDELFSQIDERSLWSRYNVQKPKF
jgi:signal peptide peptidase SppA